MEKITVVLVVILNQNFHFKGVARVASVCLSIGYPTTASAPHSIINGFKNLLAVAAATEIEFKEAETVKEYLKVRKMLKGVLQIYI